MAALVVLLGVFVVLEKSRVTDLVKLPHPQDERSRQEVQQKKLNEEKKRDYIENAPEPTPVNPPTDNDNITLTANKEAESVTVLTKLKGFAGGSCKLTVFNGASNFSATAEVIYQPDFSSCAGFSVPIAKVGNGTWTITLEATPEGGSALSKTTTLKVQ